MHHPTLEIVGCPECAAPAEIVDRFVLESTDGPIEHAIVTCTERHRLTVLVERMASRPAGGTRPATSRRRRTTTST
jgi:hypothetical protein